MRLFVDLDLGKFVLGPNTTQLLSFIRAIRGPAAEIEIQFLRGVTPQELPADASGIFTVKTKNEFDSSPLTSSPAWIKTGTSTDARYAFTLPLVNDPLDSLLGVDPLHAFTVVAATDLFTSTAHGLAALTPIQFSSTVELPAPLQPNTTYYVSATGLTTNDFKVSATSGGAVLDIIDTGTGIHSFRRITNDVIEVTLMAALQWVADGRTNETQKIDFILQNDVVREGEIPPAFPPLVHGVWFPEIIGGSIADFKAVPTVGMSLGYITHQLIDVSGTLTFLPYHLESGPATESEPEHVEPNDYDLGTNDRHWEGAAGPSGPPGVHAGIAYKWNTNTASTDPTSGKLKINHATFLSATELYISETDDDGNDLAAMLATWDDGTSLVHGRLLLQDPETPANFAIFDITGTRVDNGTWQTFPITPLLTGGTLTNNLPLRAFFIPKGDKSDSGDAGFEYQFNSATAGDPGSGKFLFNNATFLSATQLLISETDADSNALATFLASVDNGTSANKCVVIARKQGGTGFISFYITGALTDNGAYDTFPITPIASGGSITNGDTFFLNFIPVGDAGAGGGGGFPGIPWKWGDDNTEDDPGDEYFRVDDDDGTVALFLYISAIANGGASYNAFLTAQATGNWIFVYPPGLTAAQAPAIFKTTGPVTNNSTWLKIPIEFVDGFFFDFSTLTLDDEVFFDFHGPAA